MKNGIFVVLLGAGVTIVAPSLLAHHAPSAIFDMKKPVTLTGAVTKVEWVNPHIVLLMDVKGESGTVDAWKFESNPPKYGYLEKMTFPNGDVIAVDRADIK